jgi:hypothetical protein
MYVPSSELGLSQPLSRQRVCPSPRTGVGGHTRLRMRGWGSTYSDDWRKSLALCLLYGRPRRAVLWLNLAPLFEVAIHLTESWLQAATLGPHVNARGVKNETWNKVSYFTRKFFVYITCLHPGHWLYTYFHVHYIGLLIENRRKAGHQLYILRIIGYPDYIQGKKREVSCLRPNQW